MAVQLSLFYLVINMNWFKPRCHVSFSELEESTPVLNQKPKRLPPSPFTCREISLICTSSVLHFPKSLMSGVSATAGVAVSHSVILGDGTATRNRYCSSTLEQSYLPQTLKTNLHFVGNCVVKGNPKALNIFPNLGKRLSCRKNLLLTQEPEV